MKLKFTPPHLSNFGEVKRKFGAVCIALIMMMLVFSCMDPEVAPQLEQESTSEIKNIKLWTEVRGDDVSQNTFGMVRQDRYVQLWREALEEL